MFKPFNFEKETLWIFDFEVVFNNVYFQNYILVRGLLCKFLILRLLSLTGIKFKVDFMKILNFQNLDADEYLASSYVQRWVDDFIIALHIG